MQLNEDISQAQMRIEAYEPQRIKVNGVWQTNAFILTPAVLLPWPESDFDLIWAQHPEIVLIAGHAWQPLSADLQRQFAERNLGFEVMPIPALCRTYTILMAEGRNVVAAIQF